MTRLPRARCILGVLSALAAPLGAQQPALARALDLERQGSYAAAAEAYRTVLTDRPGDVAALLGLERALVPLNRYAEVIAPARAALHAAPASTAVYGVLVRAWVADARGDSARATVERWSAGEPGSESPFREWVGAVIARGDPAAAGAAIALARQRLKREDALAPEAAEVAMLQGDWTGSAREWLAALRQMSGFRFPALAGLSRAPERLRPDVLRELQHDPSAEARRLAGALTARWGDPIGGFRMLEAALPADNVQALERLNQFVEQMQNEAPAPEVHRAEGMALEAAAARLDGAAALRARTMAAQAFANGGDREGARRMLAGVDAAVGGRGVPGGAATLIGVLIDDGKLDEAEQRLRTTPAPVTTEEHAALTRRLAWSWARAGKLGRAEALLGADSTVEGLAVSGRIALLRGDIAGAAARLRAAGPYTGTREEASGRASTLALLQQIDADSLPALGAAMLRLEAGDSAAAVVELTQVAAALPPEKGGAELRLWVGRIEVARGRLKEAEAQFRAADVATASAAAAAAELELGRLLIAVGRREEAITTLEHLILTFSSSALVPQARRALDQARGAIPRT